MKKLFFCFGFLLFAISCSNSQATTDDSSKMSSYEILHQSEYGGSGVEKTEVINDAVSFAKIWNEYVNMYSGTTEIPNVDFTKKMVVTKHFQSQNSGGTTYDIQSVQQTGNKTDISFKTTAPEGMSTMAITSPIMILVVNKTQNPVVEFKAQN